MLSSYLSDIKTRCRNEQRRLDQLAGYETKRLKVKSTENGNEYYYIFSPELNDYKYIGGGTDPEVQRIKEAHYLHRSSGLLQSEISRIEKLLNHSSSLNYEDINRKLHKAYRGASIKQAPSPQIQLSSWKTAMENKKAETPSYKPHQLIHKTHDGTYVRSKSEALIYNYLLDLGITFVYELPLKLTYAYKGDLLLPDFTILSELDYQRVIYLEHQGMMSDPYYRNKFNDSVFKYWMNNYIPEKDVFFTFDLPNGGFDDTPVRDIIHRYVRNTGA